MLTKKENIFIIIILCGLFSLYYFLLIDKIGFFNIVLLTFISGTVIKSIYDIINKTGFQDIYIYDEKKNQLMRYGTLLINLLLFYMMLSVTCSNISNNIIVEEFEPFQLKCILEVIK